MISYNDIRDVHLEISSLCNASCPWCPRTFWGFPYNGGYPEINLSESQARHIFTPKFLRQITHIQINGNFGDMVMNPESAEIIEYFASSNPSLQIDISTNGAARDREFWTRLARSGATIWFCLDGLEDTHHLYRQNTSWSQVIKNAKTFIQAGGSAVWSMIPFDHNRHQVDSCRQMSQDMGFERFCLKYDGRDTAPVFNKEGQFTHVLGDYRGNTDFKTIFREKITNEVLLEDVVKDRVPKKRIDCEIVRKRSIYIAANGDVSPCCYMGFYPKTFGHGQYQQAVNTQLVPLISKNNALQYDLEESVQWFRSVEDAWQIDSYEQGRLVICDDVCGR